MNQDFIRYVLSRAKLSGNSKSSASAANSNLVAQSFKKGLNQLLAWSYMLTATATVAPVLAASEIKLFYQPVGMTLQIASLEEFAANGRVNANLKEFLGRAQPSKEQKAKFREALVAPIDIDPTLLSRLLNTDEGDRLLTILGDLIEIQGGSNGKTVLRGSMVQAAADSKGLTVINFLQTLPTNMQINLVDVLRRAKQGDFLLQATEDLVKTTEKLSIQESSNPPTGDFSQLANLGALGPVPFVSERWDLRDPSRSRSFYVDVYRPQSQPSGQIPVVVISHGLSAQPANFREFGELLASHGFLVVVPQHPGSDSKQKEDFLAGMSRQLFRLNEFIDRPLDISYTLDELERRNEREFAGQLNLTNVGAFGHSFGGYTALAAAGATIDFEHLEQDCAAEAQEFNTALHLQCRALKLKQPLPNLKDERIGAVFISNPVQASIFGPQGLAQINVPILVGAGKYDLSTPFVYEQARSFPWLVNAPKSYLLVQEGEGHVPISNLDAGTYSTINSIVGLTRPDQNLREYYAAPALVAFSQVYLGGNDDYRVYLSPSYYQYLSKKQNFKAFLVSEKSAPALQESFRAKAEEFNKI